MNYIRTENPRTIVAGIDVGAVFSKAVILEAGTILSHHLVPSGKNYRTAAESVISEALSKIRIRLEDISYIVGTGIGKVDLPYIKNHASEISCQALGIFHLFPSVKTIIDMGGQSTRIIKVDKGAVVNFLNSERCAAGSGRILQILPNIMQMDFKDIGPLSLKSKSKVKFTLACAVFVESEIISRIAEGTPKEDIIAGIHEGLASKIANLVENMKLDIDCAFTGGGAKDIGLTKAIEEKLSITLLVPPEPQITTAFGAALLAEKKLHMESLDSTSIKEIA